MPIRDVPLNIDRFGQAGSIVPRPANINVGGGYGGGGRSPIYDLLAQQAKLRNQMAKAQLKAMKEDLRQQNYMNKVQKRMGKRAMRTDTSTRRPKRCGTFRPTLPGSGSTTWRRR
jgi:hypothetical protein